MALCLGVAAIFSVTTQAAEAAQTMTNTPASATTLSSQQQAIPLIAAFMATSDMLTSTRRSTRDSMPA
jgi:hypothetical protein